MSWNNGRVVRSDGERSGSDVFQQQSNAGVNPAPNYFDAESEGLARDIEECWHRGGQNTPTTDLSLGNHRFTNVADATQRNQFTSLSQLLDRINFFTPAIVDRTGHTITINSNPPYIAYKTGMIISFILEFDNTGATSVAINSLPPKEIKKRNNANTGFSSLEAGDLSTGNFIILVDNGTDFIIIAKTDRAIRTSDIQDRAITHKKNTPAPFSTRPFVSNFSWDLFEYPNAEIVLIGNLTNVSLSNGINGGVYTLLIKQDATGGRTAAFPSNWRRLQGASAISLGASAETFVTLRQVQSQIYYVISPVG